MRTAIIAGATGLVGREILAGLLADEQVAAVHALGRRPPPVESAKLTFHKVDFARLPPLPAADEVYLALGTTIKDAGSPEAFRALDYDAILAVAQAALASGATRAGLVSAVGSDPKSRLFYSRVKGELENALAALPFEGLAIARPALLAGDRKSLGQRERPGETLGFALDRLIGFLIPAGYKPIPAKDVAAALLATVPALRGKRVLSSAEMLGGSKG